MKLVTFGVASEIVVIVEDQHAGFGPGLLTIEIGGS